MKLTIVSALAFASSLVAGQNMWSKCRTDLFKVNRDGNRYILDAYCMNSNQAWGLVHMDLARCVVNHNGNIRGQDNGGIRYPQCDQCNLERNSLWLNCNCANEGGRYARTRTDLINYIWVDDIGILTCFGHRGWQGDYYYRPPRAKRGLEGAARLAIDAE